MTRSKSFTLMHHQNIEPSMNEHGANMDINMNDTQETDSKQGIKKEKYGTLESEYNVDNGERDVNGNYLPLDMIHKQDIANGYKNSKTKSLSDSIEYHGSFNKHLPDSKPKQKRKDKPSNNETNIKISDIIGDFGKYQITVVIFAALRAMSCAMDGLSGPFLAPTVKNFECDICSDRISQRFPNFVNKSDCKFSLASGDGQTANYIVDNSQCFFREADGGHDRISCTKWSFENPENQDYMESLTVEQSLVCDREWLKSLSNSMYFVGTTLGLIFWGIISDRYGRKTAYVCSHFVTLIFGFTALFANSMCSFIVLRSINAFGMIGELIPRSIQVEIVEARYRSVTSVACQVGWATGIILVPNLWSVNNNYKFILAFPVAVSFLMLPWLYWLPESARWLMANGKYTRARNEIVRAAIINGKSIDGIDGKIQRLHNQVIQEEFGDGKSTQRIGIWKSMVAIFSNSRLCKDMFAVFTLLFMAEVIYFSLTLNVADLGGSLYLNYLISGFTELLSIFFCFIILSYLPRRFCLSLLLILSTISYLLMAVVNLYEEALPSVIMLSVNAFAKLTAIGNLMVIILVSQEVFPTVIRQFGTSLCVTVGKMGSAVAPFTHELGQVIGQFYCFAMFSVLCLLCAIIPCVLLSETGKRELPDTVVDVERSEQARKKRKQNLQSEHRNANKSIDGTVNSSSTRRSVADNIRSSFSSLSTNKHHRLENDSTQVSKPSALHDGFPGPTACCTSRTDLYNNIDNNSTGDDSCSGSSGCRQYDSQLQLTAPSDDKIPRSNENK